MKIKQLKQFFALLCISGAFFTANADAALIDGQLTPIASPPVTGITDSFYIDFTSNSSAQHFEELDTWFIAADLIMTADSGQNNTGNPNFVSLNTSGWSYAVVRYEKNGPSPDLMGAFVLNGATSVTLAELNATNPDHTTGYEHKQVFLYNGRQVPSVPEGGASVALLGLALGGLGAARRFMVKKA